MIALQLGAGKDALEPAPDGARTRSLGSTESGNFPEASSGTSAGKSELDSLPPLSNGTFADIRASGTVPLASAEASRAVRPEPSPWAEIIPAAITIPDPAL